MIFAQTQEQIEEVTKDRRICHLQGKLVAVAQLAPTFGVLEAFGVD